MSDVIYNIDRQSLSDKVYLYIKDLILSGELRGGERIPEERVARKFGVSRTPIREALKRLEEYGLIRIKPRSYAEVVDLDPSEAEDIALLRANLEVLAVELLAVRGTEEDYRELKRISDACSEFLAKGDIAGTFEMDSEFHMQIARRSRNRHLFEVFEKIDAKVQLLRLVLHLPTEDLSRFVSQHEGILESIHSHDREHAHRIMERHILDQLERYERHERELGERDESFLDSDEAT